MATPTYAIHDSEHMTSVSVPVPASIEVTISDEAEKPMAAHLIQYHLIIHYPYPLSTTLLPINQFLSLTLTPVSSLRYHPIQLVHTDDHKFTIASPTLLQRGASSENPNLALAWFPEEPPLDALARMGSGGRKGV